MTSNALDQLARMLNRSERGAQIAENWSNNLQPTYGTITDVEDPLQQGRVKVILDETNPDIQSEQGIGQGGAPTITDWIEPFVPFSGVQPEALVDKRVPITPRSGDPNRLFFGDPVFDQKEFAQAEQPNNSAMTRLPVYPASAIPTASETNVGCMIVEQEGPLKCDWLCVCLKREDGKYYWVRHMDLNHIHAAQDDGRQPPDVNGDGEAPVTESVVWDLTRPTTTKAYKQQSYNPGQAGWFGGAGAGPTGGVAALGAAGIGAAAAGGLGGVTGALGDAAGAAAGAGAIGSVAGGAGALGSIAGGGVPGAEALGGIAGGAIPGADALGGIAGNIPGGDALAGITDSIPGADILGSPGGLVPGLDSLPDVAGAQNLFGGAFPEVPTGDFLSNQNINFGDPSSALLQSVADEASLIEQGIVAPTSATNFASDIPGASDDRDAVRGVLELD